MNCCVPPPSAPPPPLPCTPPRPRSAPPAGIVHIPLSGKAARLPDGGTLTATMSAHQWDYLQEHCGISGPLILNDNGGGRLYVRAMRRRADGTPPRLVVVARELLGAGPRVQVRYRNGNRLDLRPRNLIAVAVTPEKRRRKGS